MTTSDSEPRSFPAKIACRPLTRFFRHALILFIAGLGLTTASQAQTVLVSNMDEANYAFAIIMHPLLSVAGKFTTGSESFTLSSVTLEFTAATGDDGGFSLQLYSHSNDPSGPGLRLETLSGPHRRMEGFATYTSIGTLLSPNTSYWLLAAISTENTFIFRTVNTPVVGSSGISLPLQLGHYQWQTSTWYIEPFQAFKVSISGVAVSDGEPTEPPPTPPTSAVPEPTTYGVIAGSCMLGFAAWRRHRVMRRVAKI